MREEAKERDHRKLGKELDLFMISQEVGQGLPFWLPNGATIRRELERYIVDKELASGYQHATLHHLLLLNFTRLLVTGIITKKTCSQLWIWVTGKNLSFVQ